jgi:superfamily II DNA helicase RecQ
MILQAVSVLQDKKISIVILPLDQIGKEQAGYIERIGGRPCFINADNISNRLLRQISDGKYTHLLMSPELAVSEKLRKTVIAPKFKDQLALIVIDEAHLVQQWGVKFRTDYARLHLLRTLLGRKIPWFACSATLDSLTLDALIKGVDFEPDIKIQVELLRARFFRDRGRFLEILGCHPVKYGQFYLYRTHENVL